MTTHVVTIFMPAGDRFGHPNVALGFNLSDDPQTLGWRLSKKAQALRAHVRAFHTDAFSRCPLCSPAEHLTAEEVEVCEVAMMSACVAEPPEGASVRLAVCHTDDDAAAHWERVTASGEMTPCILDRDQATLGRVVLRMAEVAA